MGHLRSQRLKGVRRTVGSPGPQAPPPSGPPSERRLHRPAPHVRPRPVQRSERGGLGVSAKSERASGAGTPRAAGAAAAPASPPSPPALGTAGRRRLPGRWRCTSRSVRSAPRVLAPPSREPGGARGSGDRGPKTAAEAAEPRMSAPGSRALAWAAHPGPGPQGGGGGRRGRGQARSSPLAGGASALDPREGRFRRRGAGGSPARSDPPALSGDGAREGRWARRGSGGSQSDLNWPERAGAASGASCEGGLRCSLIGGGRRGGARLGGVATDAQDARGGRRARVFSGCAGTCLRLFIQQTFIEPPAVSRVLCKVLG